MFTKIQSQLFVVRVEKLQRFATFRVVFLPLNSSNPSSETSNIVIFHSHIQLWNHLIYLEFSSTGWTIFELKKMLCSSNEKRKLTPNERQSKIRRVHYDDSLVNAIEQTPKYIKCVQITYTATLRTPIRQTHVCLSSGTETIDSNGGYIQAPVSKVNLFGLICLCTCVFQCEWNGIAELMPYCLLFIGTNNDLIWSLAAMHTLNLY